MSQRTLLARRIAAWAAGAAALGLGPWLAARASASSAPAVGAASKGTVSVLFAGSLPELHGTRPRPCLSEGDRLRIRGFRRRID